MSDLIKAIETKLMQRPILKQIANRLLPTDAVVISFNPETNLASIRFSNPINGNQIDAKDVPIQSLRGINTGLLSAGDRVSISFPHNSVHSPIIISVHTDDAKPVIGGELYPKYID